jgi:hypothetical protein
LADRSVQNAKYRIGPLSIDVAGERIQVQPFTEEDGEPVEDYLDALGAVPHIEIVETIDIEEGMQLYGNVLAVWPPEFPTAEQALGLGTWDPLEHLDRDFQVVFERLV